MIEIDFSQESINSYPILKELEPYTDNEKVCDNISNKGLKNLELLINKRLIDIMFLPKQELDEDHCIVLEIALDNYNGGAEQRYINVSSELFNKLIEKFGNKR